jgi:hypothetical protein
MLAMLGLRKGGNKNLRRGQQVVLNGERTGHRGAVCPQG